MPHRRHATIVRLLAVLIAAGSVTALVADEPKPPTDRMLGKEAGEVRDDNGLKMKMVWCLLGILTMEQVEGLENGTVATRPVKVLLTHGYWLGRFEVTQAEWKAVMATEPWNGQEHTNEGDDFPATFVNWGDAMEFCRKLSERERTAGRLPAGWEYTLPTEAQWDRACRARTETVFSFGDDESKLGDYAWFLDNAVNAGELYAHRVGQRKPNPWGLHDMHGNVSEWCRDRLALKLPGGRDPEVTERGIGSFRVSQGGSWSGEAWRCRSANHLGSNASVRTHDHGFRVALAPVRQAK